MTNSTRKFVPKGGALAWTDQDGRRHECNPHDPMFSTAIFLATEYYSEDAGWAPLDPAPLTEPNSSEIELDLDSDWAALPAPHLREAATVTLEPLPDNPVEVASVAGAEHHMEWVPDDTGTSGQATYYLRGCESISIHLPSREISFIVNDLVTTYFSAGHARGVEYAKHRMQELIASLGS